MSVVGIDLSLTSTGLAEATPGGSLRLGNVKTKGKKADTLEQRNDRLFRIANEVLDFAGDAKLVVIESPSFGSKFGSPHDRSGLWWLIVQALMADGIPVAQVSPQGRAKYGTGAGNSKKDVVFAHVIERYTSVAGQRIANDDIADAVLLASMGARHLGYPIERADPPAANLAAMGGVLWPAPL